jgi:hypothetical protein
MTRKSIGIAEACIVGSLTGILFFTWPVQHLSEDEFLRGLSVKVDIDEEADEQRSVPTPSH